MALNPVRTLDGRAIVVGAAVAVAVCLPAAVLGQVVADRDDGGDPSGLVLLLFVAVLVGFVAGGFVAGRRAATAPYSNGAVAAVAAFAAIQVVAVAVRLASGDPVGLAAIVFNALIAYACGLLGGLLALRRPRRPGGTP